MSDLLTIVIVSYKSNKLVIPILNRFSKLFKIIIIENSQDLNLRKIIQLKYKKNVNIIFKKNIGFGSAINFASKFVYTKYFFSINPDLHTDVRSINNLIKAAEKLNSTFGAIAPINLFKKKYNKKNSLAKVNAINGSAMFFSTAIFKQIGGFDEKIWLFFEENDLCLRARNLGFFLYTISNAQAYHEGGKSMNNKSVNYQMILTRYWHGQWSKYYFYRKHYGVLRALLISIPKFIKLIFQMLITAIYNPKKSKIYIYQICGMISSMVGVSSFVRPDRKKY